MRIRLIAITPDAEKLIEYAGRVCWRTTLPPTQSGTASFIKALIERGHLSVIEHPSATFEISGISRACSHQLVRHRLASYSQESQRSVNMADPEFVVPPSIAEHHEASTLLSIFLNNACIAYSMLGKLGIPKEDARFVLPNATATRIVMTMNFREYRHFIRVRADKAAQWEIRNLAKEILKVLYTECPSVFEDLYEEFINVC